MELVQAYLMNQSQKQSEEALKDLRPYQEGIDNLREAATELYTTISNTMYDLLAQIKETLVDGFGFQFAESMTSLERIRAKKRRKVIPSWIVGKYIQTFTLPAPMSKPLFIQHQGFRGQILVPC